MNKKLLLTLCLGSWALGLAAQSDFRLTHGP